MGLRAICASIGVGVAGGGCGSDVIGHGGAGNLTAEALESCEPLPDDLEIIESDGHGLFEPRPLATGWLAGTQSPLLQLSSVGDLDCGVISVGDCVSGWTIALQLRPDALEMGVRNLPAAATVLEYTASDGGCNGGTFANGLPRTGIIELIAVKGACVTGRLANVEPDRISGGFYPLRCRP